MMECSQVNVSLMLQVIAVFHLQQHRQQQCWIPKLNIAQAECVIWFGALLHVALFGQAAEQTVPKPFFSL